MSELIIRKGVPTDVKDMVIVEHLCFDDPWTEEMLRQELENTKIATYIVAELEGSVVGYIGFWAFSDECQINNVAVSPALQGQHIGTLLLETAIDATRAVGIRYWTLEVRAGNEPAKTLYRKAGFKKDGVRKGYYTNNGEDAILMSRRDEEETR